MFVFKYAKLQPPTIFSSQTLTLLTSPPSPRLDSLADCTLRAIILESVARHMQGMNAG